MRIDKNITFRDNSLYNKDTLYSFLFFSGYLKCKEKYLKEYNDGREYLHCKLVPTNIECKVIFADVISKYVRISFNNQGLDNILDALVNGRVEEFEKLFSYLLRDTLSYFDTRTENSYHSFLLGNTW